jgi:hypothetical protein
MGNALGGSSGSERSSDPIIAYWQDAVKSRKGQFDGHDCEERGGGVTGGYSGACGSMVGGIDDLTEEYDTTVSSKAKRDLIKKLSDGISKALKVSPPSSGASNDEMVAHLLNIVPNPRKGKSIIANKEKQEKLCLDIADVINKNYGKVIDKSLGPDGVCNQVSDIVESLSAGLNQEYVAVAASVERSLGNLQDLKQMLERSYTKLHNEAGNSDDEALKLNITGIKSIHDLIMQEVQRQLSILSNLTRTNLRDNQREMSQLLSENKDFKGLVESIKSSIGTSEWGDKLGFWMAGVNNVAQMALRVDQALKTIGMKASEYKHMSKLSDLTMKTHEIMEKMPASKLTRDYIDKYEKAIEILKKHHGHHSEIAKKVKGGNAMLDTSFGGNCNSGAYDGGVESLKKKLKTQGRMRMTLLKDFKAKCTVLMDRVYQSIFRAGRRIGSGHIKMSDDLYRFKTILEDLSIIFKEGIEYALTGYYTHANAVQHKDRFVGLLTSMLYTLESLNSHDESFREISSNMQAVIKLIDFFNDKFKVHTGHTAPDRSGASGGGKLNFGKIVRKAQQGLQALPGAIERGTATLSDASAAASQSIDAMKKIGNYEGSYEADGGGEFKAVVTLQNAKNTFTHFYSIAKFKTNLQTASGEMKKNGEKYATIVGSAVGKELTRLKEELNTTIADMEKGGAPNETGWKSGLEAIVKGSVRNDIELKMNDEKGLGGMGTIEWSDENIKEMLTCELKAKEKLYRVAQAVDEYLQKFTDAVAASPEDVQEVSKLLGSVEIMANWFNEKSGDSIASLYEVFPWSIVGMRTYMNTKLQEKTCGKLDDNNMRSHIVPSRHYYEEIKGTQAKFTTGAADDELTNNTLDSYGELSKDKGMPGVPFFPISPGRAVFAKKFAKYVVEKVYVLKNLISAFSYLGKKFGGEDLTKGTFMSPNDMYKCLSEYLYTSAFAHGWSGGDYTRFYGRQSSTAEQMESTIGVGTAAPRGADGDIPGYIQGEVYAPSISYGAASFVGGTALEATSPAKYPVDAASSRNANAAQRTLAFRIGPYMDPHALGQLDGAGGVTAGFDAPAASQVRTIKPEDLAVNTTFNSVAKVRHDFSFVMSGIPDRGDSGDDEKKQSMSGWTDSFKKEDQVFIAIIKAMAAKVFTVTGLYNMLNFSPALKHYSLSPTRLILGGGKSGGDSYTYDTPKIYPEAVELYARLPLLAEFYRDIFCFEEPCDDDSLDKNPLAGSKHLLISMVPEVGSMWSGFIQTIFDQPLNTNGLYTDNVLKRLVHEINGIYQTYKSKGQGAVSAVIADFVAEINSRYGLMNRGEITAYRNDEKTRRSEANYGDMSTYGEDPEDFDILDTDNMGTGVAPSDRYVSVGDSNYQSDHSLDGDMYKALKIFRKRIDTRISSILIKGNADRNGNVDQYEKNHFADIPDFGRLIMGTRETLKTVDSVSDQFKLISNMMVNMDVQTQADTEATVMFHEAVITPLAVLTSITTMLINYQKHIRQWDAPSMWNALNKGFISNANESLINAAGANLFADGNLSNAAAVDNGGRVHYWLNKEVVDTDYNTVIMNNVFRRGDSMIPTHFMGSLGESTSTSVNRYYTAGSFENCQTADGTEDIPTNWSSQKHVAYCLIRWEAVFKNIVKAVYGLSADLGSMCEVQFSNGRILVNHSKLQMVCEEVFSTVRKNMDKFRGVIDSKVLVKYERGDNNGSIPWVQKNLIDNLFNDQDRKSGLKRAHKIVSETFVLLANVDPTNGGQIMHFDLADHADLTTIPAGNVSKNGWCVDGTLSEMTHYHSQTMTSDKLDGSNMDAENGVTRPEPQMGFANEASLVGVLTRDDPFNHLMYTVDPNKPPPDSRSIEPAFIARWDYFLQDTADGTSDKGFRGDNYDDGNRVPYDRGGNMNPTPGGKVADGSGLMMKFNEVMAKYLEQFWDPTSLKIYSPLIEAPANGPMNQEVFKAMGWPDLVPGVAGVSDEAIRVMSTAAVSLYPDAVADAISLGHIGMLNKMKQGTEPISNYKGYAIPFDIPISNTRSIPTFQASHVDMYAMYVKHMSGNLNVPVGGSVIRKAHATATNFQAAYEAGLVAYDAAAATAKNPLTSVNAVYVAALGNVFMGSGKRHKALFGRQYTLIQATAIQTHVARLNRGTFPNGGGGGGGDHQVSAGSLNNFKNAIDKFIDPCYLAVIDRNVVNTAMGLALTPPVNAAAGKLVIDALTVTGGTTFGVDNGGETPMVGLVRYLNTLKVLIDAGATDTGVGVNWAAAAASATAAVDEVLDVATGLKTPALHGQMLRRMGNVMRGVVKHLSSVDGKRGWRASLRAYVNSLVAVEIEEFSVEETTRVTQGIGLQGIRGRVTSSGFVDVYSKPLAQRMKDEIKTLVEGRITSTTNMLTAYGNAISDSVSSIDATVYDAVATAVLCLDPVTATMLARNAAYLAEVQRVAGVQGANLSLVNAAGVAGANHVAESQKRLTQQAIAILGAKPDRFDPLFNTYTQPEYVSGMAKLLSEQFRPGLSNQGPTHPLYLRTDTSAASFQAAEGVAFTTSDTWEDTSAAAVDGTNRIPNHILSRMVGAGISNIGDKFAPTPVDVIDARQTVAQVGLHVINADAAAANEWHVILESIASVAGERWIAAIMLTSESTREQLPSPLTAGKGDPRYPLFASLAKVMRTALTEVNRAGIKMNVTQSIAEVPLRMKEVMKAQLPVFNEMFKLLSKKAELLNGMVKINIGSYRHELEKVYIEVPISGVHGGTFKCESRDQTAGKRWYTTLLDRITGCCDAMSTTIESVLNELNDAPLYLELNENSITEFKNRTSKLPFMPLSSVTAFLAPSCVDGGGDGWPMVAGAAGDGANPRRDPGLGYPGTSAGDPFFMYNYGTRLLLHDHKVKILPDHMPGVKAILTAYNTVSQGQRKMEEKTTGQFFGKLAELIKYAHTARIYSPLFGANKQLVDKPKDDEDNQLNPTYQMTLKMAAIMGLTSETDVSVNVDALTGFVSNRSIPGKINRHSSIIYNILDLNISPINIHAMRREIPLINLYNYAHTFDSFVTEVVQSSYSGEGGKDHTLGANGTLTTHDVLSGLCKNPYARVPKDTYYGKLQNLIAGKSSIDAYGYPKFISDQLWGKVLLQNTVVSNGTRRDDRDPRAGNGAANANNTELHYQKDGRSVDATLPDAQSEYIHELGRLRFDTKFARNLMFLANVQRIMMHKINTELTAMPYPVVSGPSVTNRKITDYRDGETYSNLSID